MAPIINFSGLASGIDSNSLITAILNQQRSAQINPLQRRVDDLTQTNSSFDDLSTLLTKLQTAAGKFRAVNGGAIAKTGVSSNETVATASVGNSAQTGTYALAVTQLARGATYSFADRFTSSTSVVNSAINNGAAAANRTLSVSTGNGSEQETVNIVLTNSTTIGDVVSQFNATSTKSEASLVNVGTSSAPSYAMVLSSKNTGNDKGDINVSVGSEIQTAGVGAFITASSTLTQAQNAQFSISGISGTIDRGSNNVSDIIPGVSFNLISIGNSTISVNSDPEASKGAVKGFVDAYNEVVKYIQDKNSTQSEQSNGQTINIFGPLSQTSVDDNVLSQLRSSLQSASSTGRTVNTLADFGVTTQRDGTLGFNEDTFKSAFNTDSEGVGQVTQNLGENLSAVNGTIAQFIQFNGIIGTSKFANSTDISHYEDRISNIESSLSKQQESLTAQYARLESVIGRLNQQQSTLTSLLPR